MGKRILFLAANPTLTERLRVDEELREIDESLKRAKYRDNFELIQKLAVRPRDLQTALLEVNPQIVHFSGHGMGQSGIVLESNNGKPQLVSSEALGDLFQLIPGIECVVLNACYTKHQADALVKHIRYVIGMKASIQDQVAITFTVGLYDAIFAGSSYRTAFDIGRNALQLSAIPQELVPVLLENESRLQQVSNINFSDNEPPFRILRSCLENAFDSESVRSFCQDYFTYVFKQLHPVDRLEQIITMLISHCAQHGKIDYLWQSIKKERPGFYEIYFPLWQKRTNI